MINMLKNIAIAFFISMLTTGLIVNAFPTILVNYSLHMVIGIFIVSMLFYNFYTKRIVPIHGPIIKTFLLKIASAVILLLTIAVFFSSLREPSKYLSPFNIPEDLLWLEQASLILTTFIAVLVYCIRQLVSIV